MKNGPVSKPMHREESEQQLVHRLEAFSDIVIGFSMAELTLSLSLPDSGMALFTKSGYLPLLAFVVTFTLVCGVWWLHHRLFRHFFVPTNLNIVLNFAALGGVAFLVYSMQVWVHTHLKDNVGYIMYAGSYAFILTIFAFLSWSGLRMRGHEMDAELLERGRDYVLRMSVLGLGFALIALVSGLFGGRSDIGQIALVVVLGVLALVRILRRFGRKPISSPSA